MQPDNERPRRCKAYANAGVTLLCLFAGCEKCEDLLTKPNAHMNQSAMLEIQPGNEVATATAHKCCSIAAKLTLSLRAARENTPYISSQV